MTPDEVLERTQWDTFWVPDDCRVVDRPELKYTAAPRDVHYLNQVLRTRGGDLARSVAEVAQAHAGVRSRWMVGPQSGGAPLEAALAAGGYAPLVEHWGYSTAVADFVPRGGGEARRVTDLAGLKDWVEVNQRAFDRDLMKSDEDFALELSQCVGPGVRVHRVVGYLDGEPVSCGSMTSFSELRFGFFWSGATVPAARGKGVYSSVVAERVRWAGELGLDRVGLYAITTTSAPIVDKQGFERHGAMVFWDRLPAE